MSRLSPRPLLLLLLLLPLPLLAVSLHGAPIARHVAVTNITRNSDFVVWLAPYSATNVTVNVTSLPDTGVLYQVSTNYINYGITPYRGAPINRVPTALVDGAFRLVYSAPSVLTPVRFTYIAFETSAPSEVSQLATVELSASTLPSVSSSFLFDNDNWTIVAVEVTNTTWSDTSMGGLNRYIYGGEIDLVLNADNDVRWSFFAPPKFLGSHVLCFNGTLEFWMGAFVGDFSASTQYARLQTFVALECDSCNGGQGITLAQRSNNFTGDVTHYSFNLSRMGGWLKDPHDTRVTIWPDAPTDCEFAEVLSNLSAIRVYGDLTTDFEVMGMDEFALRLGPGIPLSCYN